MNNLFDISEKKAIVTGASRGLGKAMAQGLHDAGVTLVIMGTNEKIVAVAKEMTTPECPVYPVMANFKDNAAVAKAFDEAMELLGNDLDILVNNAWSTMPACRSAILQSSFRWSLGILS